MDFCVCIAGMWYVVCGMVGPVFQEKLESFMKYALTTYITYLINFDMIEVNIIIFSNCSYTY